MKRREVAQQLDDVVVGNSAFEVPVTAGDAHGHACGMSSGTSGQHELGDPWPRGCYYEKHYRQFITSAVRSTLSYTPMFRKPRAGAYESQ